MITLILLFYISLVGIIAMTLYKRHEIKTGKTLALSRIGEKTDQVFHRALTRVRDGISYFNKHTFIAMAQWIAYHILIRVRNWYIQLQLRAHKNPHMKKVIDMVRGRGEVNKQGVSFYLRRISSNK